MHRHLALALALGSALSAQRPAAFAERLAKAEALLRQVMADKQIPGLSFAVGGRKELWAVKGLGFADLEHHIQVRPETAFRTASIAKPMTALLCIQAEERGELDLRKPVRSYLPEFPEKRWPIPLQLLLSHLGGVRHYKPGETSNARYYRSTRRGLRIFAKDPLLHEPGTKFRYTTYGYNLAGAALCAATGKRFEKLLQERLFKPARMHHSYIDHSRRLIPHRARGYARGRGGKVVNCRFEDTSYKIPGGGLRSTASDLVRFGQALLNHELCTEESLDRLFTRAKTKAGKTLPYALGFNVSRAEKPRVIGHSGGQAGTNCMLVLRPDDGLCLALMCNMEGAGMNTLGPRLARILLGEN